MKTYKSIKKISIFGGILLVATGLTTLVTISCSNSSDPAIAASTTFNFMDKDTQRKISINQNVASIEPAVNFDGKDYKNAPTVNADFTEVPISDQKAVAYFRSITNFTIWLQGFVTQTQNFLSSVPTLLADIDNRFLPLVDLACGLSATINDGVNTARLGLNSITFTMDLQQSIETNFKPYNGTTDVGEGGSITWSETITNIQLKYNWWTTDSSNTINWQPDNWDVNSQNLAMWVNLPAKPKATYLLNLDDLSFDVQEKAEKKDNIYIIDGKTSIVDPDAAFKFSTIATKKETQDIITFLVEADRNRRGDVLNGTFYGFVTSEKEKQNLNNFISILK